MNYYDPVKALRSYPGVRTMLAGIRRDLWYIFLPASEDELAVLERNILVLKSREVDREKVIAIQKLAGFPFRPNAPLREMLIKARIREMKKAMLRLPDEQETDQEKPSQ